jgi:putative transposase
MLVLLFVIYQNYEITPTITAKRKRYLNLKRLILVWRGLLSVLQDVVKRVKVTMSRFLKGDSNGKRSGKPRFKARNRYRTFTYPQMKDGCLTAT